MSTYPLVISSPDGDIFRGDASRLVVRGTEGELAVLAGHVPFVTAIVRGSCAVEDADGVRRTGMIEPGLLTVQKDRVTVLTTAVHWDR